MWLDRSEKNALVVRVMETSKGPGRKRGGGRDCRQSTHGESMESGGAGGMPRGKRG